MTTLKINKQKIIQHNREYVKAGGLSRDFEEKNADLIIAIKSAIQEDLAKKSPHVNEKNTHLTAIVIAKMAADVRKKKNTCKLSNHRFP